MSVIVTVWFMADPQRLEQVAKERSDQIHSIAERAKEAGVIAHRFYGGDGQVMVIDEWPDEESFQRFFDGAQEMIAPLFEAAGVTTEPAVRFWHVLDMPDKIGWGA